MEAKGWYSVPAYSVLLDTELTFVWFHISNIIICLTWMVGFQCHQISCVCVCVSKLPDLCPPMQGPILSTLVIRSWSVEAAYSALFPVQHGGLVFTFPQFYLRGDSSNPLSGLNGYQIKNPESSVLLQNQWAPPDFLHILFLSCKFHICYQTTAATIQMTVLSQQQTGFTVL